MTSCKQVIKLALSKLGIAGGAKVARDADMQLGLTVLQSLYRELISSGRLGHARPITPEAGAYVARENDRIFRTPGVTAISLPDQISSHALDCGWGDDPTSYYDWPFHSHHTRLPRDGAFVIVNDVVSGNTAEWIYEAYTARWISVHDLSLQEYQEVSDINGNVIEVLQPSDAPLSTRDLNGLAALLALRLADHFGQQPSALTVRDATEYEGTLVLRWGEPEGETIGKEWF